MSKLIPTFLKISFFKLLYFGGVPFSILATIGLVSKYSYKEMALILRKWNHSTESSGKNIIATWECSYTLISIYYNSKDEYLYIEKEIWK